MRNRLVLAALLCVGISAGANSKTGVPVVDDQTSVPVELYFPRPLPVDRILEPPGRHFMIGLYGGPNLASHSGRFTMTENGITCCTFDEGSGTGFVLGLKAFFPLTDQIDITPRVSFETRPGTFSTLGEPLPILGQNNQVETMQFRDELNVSLSGIAIDAMGSFAFTDFGLYAAVGPTFWLAAGKGFTKDETIANPNGVDYKTGGTTKRILEGDFQNLESLQIGGRGGLGARIPLAEAMYINPEVLYTFPFTNVTTLDDWKTSGLQLTVGFLLAL